MHSSQLYMFVKNREKDANKNSTFNLGEHIEEKVNLMTNFKRFVS